MQIRIEPSQGLSIHPRHRLSLPPARSKSFTWNRPPQRVGRASSPFAYCHGDLPTTELVAALRRVLDAERAAIGHQLEAGGDARRVIRQQSELIDALIRHLMHLARRREPSVIWQAGASGLAVTAVGGYGRAELAPHSDIDVLFLIPARPHGQDIRTIEFVLYRLWDLGLQVGHAVRTVDDCLDLARSDCKTATSLLDLRFVGGRRTLHDQLALRLDAALRDQRDALARSLMRERAERHARFAKQSTPHVKLGPGGLRDAQTVLWLARLHGRFPTTGGSAGSHLDPDAQRGYAAAVGLLWSVRCHLHHLSGRPEERLRRELLAELACRVQGDGPDAEVTFLRHWCEATRTIADLCARSCDITSSSGGAS